MRMILGRALRVADFQDDPGASGVSQVVQDPLEEGREALQRRAWVEGYELLQRADETGELGPEDILLLAEAAMWAGHLEDVIPNLERAYRGHLQAGNTLRAAYVATWIAHDQRGNLQMSVANGWMSRAKRLLDLEEEAPEHGYWALQQSLVQLSERNHAEAFQLAKQAEELGRRFGDRNLEIRGLQRQGNVLIEQGEVAEGKLLLDEASAAALAGELDPFSTLTVYCNTIGACRDVADYESAGQWTDLASDFCDANAMSAFPGLCRVNHAEVMKFKGRLTEAHELADRASVELSGWSPRIAGAAFYELGEVRLRLGELAQAEQAFREADEFGRNPEPGLSLLRLAQGDTKGALASIRRFAADETMGLPAQARMLPAAVDIAVTAGEVEEAAGYADRLGAIADTFDSSALRAGAAFACGQVALAEGEPETAFQAFRRARTSWDSTGATYDVARAREHLGRALRGLGDEGAALWELQAAAARFERLGAVRDADRVAELLMRDTSTEVMKTFLFTDIVGSTELASAVGSDRHWVNLLRRHDDALRAIFGDYNGQVVDHTGDGFFAAFEEADDALGAAIAIQRAVDQEFEFDIRIGVHSDGALQTRKNYHGKGVHAAARIGSAAVGREILASQATVGDRSHFQVTKPRTITLKGFKEPIEVCSVEWQTSET
jgi:class 3 adenylate cyclase